MRSLLIVLAAAIAIPLLAARAVLAADPARENVLRRIAEAVASEEKLPISGVAIVSTRTVTQAEVAQWREKLTAELSVVYAPPSRPARRLRYSDLRDLMSVQMAGDRSPEKVVSDVVRPGRVVATVKWRLAPDLELDSLAVFEGETLLFDTLLSMPVIHDPVFSAPHL